MDAFFSPVAYLRSDAHVSAHLLRCNDCTLVEKIAKLQSPQYGGVTRQLDDGIRNRPKRGSGSAQILHGVARSGFGAGSGFGLVDR